ncbi:hypothetical protein I317_03677 [Kwoniella heveanensis CBS 569]|nr:hypothetical protein I317_03677 [Kwoniella heveanensis CBS 569]
MSQRQGRRSLGLAPLHSSDDGGPTEQQKYEEFRKKHSRQNRDIIMDNISRKAIIKGLQDDIAKLHRDVYAVKQANVMLRAQVTRMQHEAGKMGGQHVRDALDQLITALPALSQLRDSLHIIQPISSRQPHSESTVTHRPTLLVPVENTYATRPAEMARQVHGLWDLAEGSEQESEVGEIERVVVHRSKGRTSESGSVSASRSPRRSTAESYVEFGSSPLSSPAKSASPSPKKHSTVTKRPRRRRESGLLHLPHQTETRSRRSPPPPVQEEIRVKFAEPEQADSEWEEGGAFEIQPDEAVAIIGAGEDILMPSDAVVLTSSVKGTEVLDTIKEASGSEGGSGSSRSNGLTGSNELTSEIPADEMNADENHGFRGRRARSSVNYKEPSLNKKMRKPDGVSAEEALKPVSRKSVASSSRPGTPKKGGEETNSSLSPAPPETSTSHSASASLAKVTLPRQTGMRRKSVLTTKASISASRRKPTVYLELGEDSDGDMDADDVDALVDAEMGQWDDVRDVEERTASLRVAGPAKRGKSPGTAAEVIVTPLDEPLVSASSSRAPMKGRTSTFRPTPSSTASTFAPDVSRAEGTARSRPTPTNGPSSSTATKAKSMASLGLGNGRPIMPSSSARSSSGSSSVSGSRHFTPTGPVVSRDKKSSAGTVTEKDRERVVLTETDGLNHRPSAAAPAQPSISINPSKEERASASAGSKGVTTEGEGRGTKSSNTDMGVSLGPELGLGLGTGTTGSGSSTSTTIKERVASRGRNVSGGTGGTTSRRRQSAVI